MGRRVAKTDGAGTWQYLYGDLNNPFQLTAMRDPAGTLSYYYYDGNGSLLAFDKGATRYYVATDQVGTPKVVTDTSGTVVKLMEYDSFGRAVFDSNQAFELPVGFAGGINDAKTGLVRFGYRDYEPSTGRWTAKDPIFFAGGQGNLFGYVQNNPVNWVDPLGLMELPPNPSGLPPGWEPDPTHRDPTGKRFRDPCGRPLDWHPGQPGKPGWGGRDHWHDPNNFGRKHLPPGFKIPDPAVPPTPPPWWTRLPVRFPGLFPIIILPPGWRSILPGGPPSDT